MALADEPVLRTLIVSEDKYALENSTGEPWEYKNGHLYTNLGTGYAKVIVNVSDPAHWTPDFFEGMTAYLAAKLSQQLAGDTVATYQQLSREAKRHFDQANTLDSFQTPRENLDLESVASRELYDLTDEFGWPYQY